MKRLLWWLSVYKPVKAFFLGIRLASASWQAQSRFNQQKLAFEESNEKE